MISCPKCQTACSDIDIRCPACGAGLTRGGTGTARIAAGTARIGTGRIVSRALTRINSGTPRGDGTTARVSGRTSRLEAGGGGPASSEGGTALIRNSGATARVGASEPARVDTDAVTARFSESGAGRIGTSTTTRVSDSGTGRISDSGTGRVKRVSDSGTGRIGVNTEAETARSDDSKASAPAPIGAPIGIVAQAMAAPPRSRPKAWGLAAGAMVIAALVWVGISRATDMNLGFLIIGVAAAIGLVIAYRMDDERDTEDGIAAVVLTLVGLILTKAILTNLMVMDIRDAFIAEQRSDSAMVARLASGMDEEDAQDDDDAPPAVAAEAAKHGMSPGQWLAAQTRWEAMPSSERDRMRTTAVKEALEDFSQVESAWIGLGTFFGPLTGIGSTIVALGLAWTLGTALHRRQGG